MNHRYFFASIAFLTLATTSLTHGAETVLPESLKTVPKMYPPFPSEFTKPGEGKFVIFTREATGKEWDFVAGVWECIPSRPDMPVTKRGEFCHSWWNASPLLNVLVPHESRGLHPRFARLQVNSGDRDYTVHLYDINYRTWEARCIWQGRRLQAFGVMGDSIFCNNDDAWFLLDTATAKVSPEVPFIPLDAEGDFWLVRKPGETQGAWSYDRNTQNYIAHFKQVDPPLRGIGRSRLSQDGQNRAWMLLPMPRGWRGGAITGQLILQRARENQDITVPIEVQASAGSGIPVIPKGVQFMFTPGGKLELRASTGDDSANERVWTIDIATGKVDEEVTTRKQTTPSPVATLDGVVVPEYLTKEVEGLSHFGRAALAPAFLMHQGILPARPSYPDCTAAVSPDGRHVLYRAKKGPLAGTFIYGDLQTKQVVQWESPPALDPRASLEFAWVETPK